MPVPIVVAWGVPILISAGGAYVQRRYLYPRYQRERTEQVHRRLQKKRTEQVHRRTRRK